MEITFEVLVLPSDVDPAEDYYARIGTDPQGNQWVLREVTAAGSVHGGLPVGGGHQ